MKNTPIAKDKSRSELLALDSNESRAALKKLGPPPIEPSDMPNDWESMSRNHLQWLADHGTYGQRLIAGRYLRDWSKDHPSQ